MANVCSHPTGELVVGKIEMGEEMSDDPWAELPEPESTTLRSHSARQAGTPQVKEIIDLRLHYGKLRYRVHWVGRHDLDSTWHEAAKLENERLSC